MNTLQLFDLKGKTILITGSGSGLGLAMAKGLGGAGATIVLNGRNPNKIELARKKLNDYGITAHTLVFDVTKKDEITTAISDFESNTARIDVLINNAGINLRGPFSEFEEEKWKEVLDINVNGAMLVSQVVGRYMIKHGTGKIINICSMQSELGRPTIVPYTVSKGAVKMLTKALSTEWAKYNIQVNGIGPGYFETELTRPLKEDKEFDEWLCKRTPSNRWGKPEELVGSAVFLASSASNYINGQIIYVDGGLLSSV